MWPFSKIYLSAEYYSKLISRSDLDEVVTDIEEIDSSPLLSESSENLGPVGETPEPKPMKSALTQGPPSHFTPFAPYARDSLDRLRHSIGHNLHNYSNQVKYTYIFRLLS